MEKYKMKITKRQLRKIILEELEEIRTDGRGFSPGSISKYSTSDSEGEGRMARGQLGRIEELASMIQNMVQDDSDLEEWVESKITKAQDYLSSVLNYMRGEELSEQEIDEKIKKVKGGYKATTKSGRELSKKPKSREDALKQLGAVEASKAERGDK